MRPNADALRELQGTDVGRTCSWRQLHDACLALRNELRREVSGVVIAALANGIEAPVALLGALWAGLDVLPISSDATPGELRALTRRLEISAVIARPELWEQFAGSVPTLIDPMPGDTPTAAPDDPACESPSDSSHASGAILLQSSGTTAAPKIVRRSVASLGALGRNLTNAFGLAEADSMLLTIPLSHSYGIDVGLAAATHSGCCLTLCEDFAPGITRRALHTQGITIWPAVPLMFDAVSRAVSEPMASWDSGFQLRRAISAGSPLPLRVFEQFERAYGVRIGQLYGATEIAAATYCDPERPDFDPECVGWPMDGVQIRIADPKSDSIAPLPIDREGEILVSSPCMLTDYVDTVDPVDTADADSIAEGFHRSGDLGRVDAAGRLWLTGRRKLLIDVGGRNVNPLEVEAVLCRHPKIQDAVVMAAPFSDTASRVKAVVVLEPGEAFDAAELKAFSRERLASYKVPRSFEVRDALPRSPSGKILRQELEKSGAEP
jgi:long-chain acyl-CoA synthetase